MRLLSTLFLLLALIVGWSVPAASQLADKIEDAKEEIEDIREAIDGEDEDEDEDEGDDDKDGGDEEEKD